MIIKKILDNPPTDEKDLNKYYEKREKLVKWQKNDEDDDYYTNVNMPPVYTPKRNEDNSVDNRFISIGLVLYEPKKQKK